MRYTQREKLALFLLRVGLAMVFLYAAIASLLNPDVWVGFLPEFVSEFAEPTFVLTLFSLYQILLALWLFSGKETMHAALLTSATLFALIVQNIGALDILFRDIAILFAALALASLSASEKRRGPTYHSDQPHYPRLP